jgi:hypothetical protein
MSRRGLGNGDRQRTISSVNESSRARPRALILEWMRKLRVSVIVIARFGIVNRRFAS